ncbi:MAG TPA: glycosyltransferase family 87 protein [Candidatus Limnocylindrales bacterium]|nr:glycosyltransferase family 87 protein [Candidatus Limnocylindrales bacterium]
MVNAAWTGRIKAIIVGVGLGLTFLMSINWWNIYAYHVPKCPDPNCVADFVTFYAQARLIWDDRRSLYDLDKQLIYQNQLAPVEKVLPFVYPPITAALLAPLALVPFSTAFLLMTIVNLLLIGQSARLLIRHLSLTPDQSRWLLLLAFCNYGVHGVVFYGQTSAIVLYVLTLHILAQRHEEKPSAGLWAGLLCVKPQYLAVPHFILLLGGRWREMLVGAAVSATLVIGLFLWIGIDASTQYFQLAQRMMTTDRDWWNQWRGMHNLRVLAIYWLPEAWSIIVWWILSALVVATLVWINRRSASYLETFAVRWIVNSLGLLIILPHLFTHDLTLLIIPGALLLSMSPSPVPPVLGIGLVIFALLPAVNYLFPTIMALALVLAFTASLFFAKSRLARM